MTASITPISTDRTRTADHLRELADEIEAGRIHATVAVGIYTDKVAADEDLSTWGIHFVAGDVVNSQLLGMAVLGLLHERAMRIGEFVQWSDLEGEGDASG